jgi:hypothetical protein
MKRREMLLSSYENDDVGRWADIKAAMGDVVSPDHDQLLMMFHLERMRDPEVSVNARKNSRGYLVEAKVIEDITKEPITVYEHLRARSINGFIYDKKHFSTTPGLETIFLFDQTIVLHKFFMFFQQYYAKHIDIVRSSVVRFEIWTINEEHIKFLKLDNIYPLPDKIIRWAYIAYHV